ncbi:MAG: hypothetical protein RMH84_00740 [Sulfolobales archaeon]|nr:hypothetical protein [Sulfolobales archaeon]MCX8208461.1 hypothetical protein [Sulfolobales archaeon]MDW8010112.1 hypothetical protein [Sulfolobales archaeon]
MEVDLFKVGLVLFIAGFVAAFAAMLLAIALPMLAAEGGRTTGVSGGGCVLIMFVPICFGVGEGALPLMALAVALAVVLVVVSVLLYRGFYRVLKEVKI